MDIIPRFRALSTEKPAGGVPVQDEDAIADIHRTTASLVPHHSNYRRSRIAQDATELPMAQDTFAPQERTGATPTHCNWPSWLRFPGYDWLPQPTQNKDLDAVNRLDRYRIFQIFPRRNPLICNNLV